MKADVPKPTAVDVSRRSRILRTRALPLLVFGTTLSMIVQLWKDHVAVTTMVGHAGPVMARVTPQKSEMLAGVKVAQFPNVSFLRADLNHATSQRLKAIH